MGKLSKKKEVRRKEAFLVVTVVAVLIVVLLVAILGFMFIKPPSETVQGQVEATEIRISGKLPGRVEKFYVEEGQRVQKGDTLVKIYSSLMEAKLAQAQAMERVAEATDKKVDAGTRTELVEVARDMWRQAVASADIAQKSYRRIERLFEQGVVSEQKRDEAKAAYEVASAAEKAALSQYEMAKNGAQRQDKEASKAMLNAAQGGVEEVDAIMEDSYLLAPDNGVVIEIYPHASELVATGMPVMSLQIDERWVSFNVKETMLSKIGQGDTLDVYVPAYDADMKVKVFYIRDLGTYADWQATKSTGDYDVRTFRIKARPVSEIEGLRPGMTVVLR